VNSSRYRFSNSFSAAVSASAQETKTPFVGAGHCDVDLITQFTITVLDSTSQSSGRGSFDLRTDFSTAYFESGGVIVVAH
jgi:hypothetical protein